MNDRETIDKRQIALNQGVTPGADVQRLESMRPTDAPPYHTISQEDWGLLWQIARRGALIMAQHAAEKRLPFDGPGSMISLCMDVATVHLQRPLNLWQFNAAHVEDFTRELYAICGNLNRALASFPESVTLTFAQRQ
jgi:hypothetical protein